VVKGREQKFVIVGQASRDAQTRGKVSLIDPSMDELITEAAQDQEDRAARKKRLMRMYRRRR